ncbi:hypothetical protein GE061_005394 [Apolygus lucorum]|uniref:Uncharacterized protein n=1 Tax=Apolygus lucorum TaxID=248454 RepID=A0A8S9WW56_APOLU|nr:hypothetical protein GE061_005394 [Apolygus lucorum]
MVGLAELEKLVQFGQSPGFNYSSYSKGVLAELDLKGSVTCTVNDVGELQIATDAIPLLPSTACEEQSEGLFQEAGVVANEIRIHDTTRSSPTAYEEFPGEERNLSAAFFNIEPPISHDRTEDLEEAGNDSRRAEPLHDAVQGDDKPGDDEPKPLGRRWSSLALRRVHLESFLERIPRMQSHYCRSSSTKTYLQSDIVSMAQFYAI